MVVKQQYSSLMFFLIVFSEQWSSLAQGNGMC